VERNKTKKKQKKKDLCASATYHCLVIVQSMTKIQKFCRQLLTPSRDWRSLLSFPPQLLLAAAAASVAAVVAGVAMA